jgi:DNA-binding response OmpR family regulator
MQAASNAGRMKLLLVEDDLDLGESLLAALQVEGYRVQWLRRLAEARAALHESAPELIILDLGLPDGEGHALLQDLRIEEAELPVLVLSARDALHERLRSLDGGADDFLLKPFALEELLSRLRALARRRYGDGQGVLRLRGLELHPAAQRAQLDGQALALTPSEYRLLSALLQRADRVLTRRFLDEQVLADSQSDSNILDVHIASLRRKLGEGWIRTVRGVGYVMDRAP